MLDGIALSCRLDDFLVWKETTGIVLHCGVNADTGEVKQKIFETPDSIITTIIHSGKFETYDIVVKEVHRRNFKTQKISKDSYLSIKGSLHKNHFKGANYQEFDWPKVEHEIRHLCKSLCLKPEKTKIDNLEVGVNIETSFEPFTFLEQNLISYKGLSFNRYDPDKNGVCLGYVCNAPTQYRVKIYDKGLQNNLPYNLMRFEMRYVKMEIINRMGIYHLADLMDFDNVARLLVLLLNAWDNVLLHDSTVDIHRLPLKQKEKDLLLTGSNPRFWECLKKQDRRQFNYKRDIYRSLIKKFGAKMHDTIREAVHEIWDKLTGYAF